MSHHSVDIEISKEFGVVYRDGDLLFYVAGEPHHISEEQGYLMLGMLAAYLSREQEKENESLN